MVREWGSVAVSGSVDPERLSHGYRAVERCWIKCHAATGFIDMLPPGFVREAGSPSIRDSRPSQAAYALTDHPGHSDSVVEHFERWHEPGQRLDFSSTVPQKS